MQNLKCKHIKSNNKNGKQKLLSEHENGHVFFILTNWPQNDNLYASLNEKELKVEN